MIHCPPPSPPPPGENTIDLHVHKHDEAVGILPGLRRGLSSEVGAGRLVLGCWEGAGEGNPMLGWEQLQVHWASPSNCLVPVWISALQSI